METGLLRLVEGHSANCQCYFRGWIFNAAARLSKVLVCRRESGSCWPFVLVLLCFGELSKPFARTEHSRVLNKIELSFLLSTIIARLGRIFECNLHNRCRLCHWRKWKSLFAGLCTIFPLELTARFVGFGCVSSGKDFNSFPSLRYNFFRSGEKVTILRSEPRSLCTQSWLSLIASLPTQQAETIKATRDETHKKAQINN